MNVRELNIARSFSRHPAGRFRTDGPFSGELFRKKFLVPMLQDECLIEIDMDGTRGFGSSFLEEAFGGLVRVEGYSAESIRKRMKLKCSDASTVEEVWSYIDDANSEKFGPG